MTIRLTFDDDGQPHKLRESVRDHIAETYDNDSLLGVELIDEEYAELAADLALAEERLAAATHGTSPSENDDQINFTEAARRALARQRGHDATEEAR